MQQPQENYQREMEKTLTAGDKEITIKFNRMNAVGIFVSLILMLQLHQEIYNALKKHAG